MARSRASAKKAGTAFERLISDHLKRELGIQEIDRMPKTGALDKGDVSNVRDSHGRLIAIECKNTTKMSLPAWTTQAHTEATNYQAHTGITIHKRHGTTAPGSQWVTMTVDDLIKLLTTPNQKAPPRREAGKQ
ncbi:hypothetical protein YH66_09700 [[Brevibacterium] flavum]|uniref:Holliday junction resolvase n=1 Tax=[Brevibacterium] flavum TaxID=92706 RepID=A0A0F6SRE2_9CORY|nr:MULTISPECIES: hypothetical protein [Corynebacterium]AKF27804.1 hypothetical protein YH66_09700 [[Brevibacterium] flavum]ANE08636.1 hypothetical protein A3654_09760 [Corynebacterium glutamicum]AST21049.1 hypothetical protein CEY17_09840 [Corynebacterium glutamicum ATCC 14067]KEI23558.1 hypothetical protein KIQ_013610 [Corynebacterium glutamicum ATCC 14067]KIH73306.1 hypothetical protein SD36_09730 [Corynebacterium glutamicum]